MPYYFIYFFFLALYLFVKIEVNKTTQLRNKEEGNKERKN